MEDVTDTVFRQMLIKAEKFDVFFTEFVNVEGLCSGGKEKILPRFKYSEKERPIVAQIWGKNPDNFYQAAKMIKELKFNGLDLNFGCSYRTVLKQNACGALIGNHSLVEKIISAVKVGAKGLPISLKTRLAKTPEETREWLEFLLKQDLAALTLHGRTIKENYATPANWKEIKKAVVLRDQLKSKTLIIGNGDVKTVKEAWEKAQEDGVDGVMIGRGLLKILSQANLVREHVALFEKTWGGSQQICRLKKIYRELRN